ncbi:TetR/AcrR family transcriptional regulator [Pendulispora albinea]|uniref:TetR/AcrR family transcriptional regulator n=1 Tax=Pendulispora albinea TaxID=2741071 RepID=A0ABZ2LZ26_9BACT
MPPTTPPKPDPLSRRAERTRRKLVAAARSVFEARGVLEARIVDIANEAGVAVGSFYTYFDSKEELLREVAGALFHELIPPLPPDVGADPRARIEAGNRAYVHAYQKNARILALVQHQTLSDPTLRAMYEEARATFIARVERSIRRLQRAGLTPNDVSAALSANILAGMVHEFCYFAFGLDQPKVRRPRRQAFHEEEAIVALTTLWIRALELGAAPKAPRRVPSARGARNPKTTPRSRS